MVDGMVGLENRSGGERPAPTQWRDEGIEVRIEPVRTRISLRQLPSIAPVVAVLAVRDFKAKFKQSLLGPVWIVLQPLLLLFAFLVGFHSVANVGTAGVPYIAFVLTAIGAWSYFQSALSMGAMSLLSNVQLLRRTACPRLAFPTATLIANLPSMLVPMVAAVLLAGAEGRLSARLPLLALGIIWLWLVTAGSVAITSSLTVRYRDLVAVLPILLQVGMFVAPVGYQSTDLPGLARIVIELNPLTGVIDTWRWAILSISPPPLTTTLLSAASTVVLVVAGWLLFTRSEPTMADVV
jgi:lipopolysaccharide transport system permease protein